MSRLAIGLIWLLHFLPLPLLAALGRGFGLLLYPFARWRRHVVQTNLRLCFPELDEPARRRLARRHFALLGRSLFERGLLWWASAARLKEIVPIEGLEHLRRAQDEGRAVILLAPHFLGLDMAGTRITLEIDAVSIYSRQRNKVFDRWLYHGRSRFGDQLLLSRSDGVRSTVKAMKSGRPFYYLPDLDYGRRESIFVPFFGIPAATISALPRLARLADAAVLPCVARLQPRGGCVLQIGAPWENFPGGDVEGDVARMNTWLEGVIRTMPEQYYWVHRRFKTRPRGEPKFY